MDEPEPPEPDESEETEKEEKKRKPLLLGLVAAALVSTALIAGGVIYLKPKQKAVTKSGKSKKRAERIATVDQYITSSLLKSSESQAIHKHTEDKKSAQGRGGDSEVSDRALSNIETPTDKFLEESDPALLKDVDVETTGDRIDGVTLSIDASTSDQEIGEKLDRVKELLDQNAPGAVESLTLKFRDGRKDMRLNIARLTEDYAIKTIQAKFRYISPRIYKAVEVEVDATQSLNQRGRSFWERVRVKKVVVHVNSNNWDTEPSQDRVNLLNDTVQYLKAIYPDVTPFLTLKFDDGRSDLEMKSVL